MQPRLVFDFYRVLCLLSSVLAACAAAAVSVALSADKLAL